MKPITLHPASVLAGALFVVAGAAQSHGIVQSIPIHDVRLVGEIPAEWWTYVYVNAHGDGSPDQTYTVPSDRYFVVTDLYRQGLLRVNGQSVPALVAVERGFTSTGNGTRVVFPPGALVESFNSAAGAQAEIWGYLEPVR